MRYMFKFPDIGEGLEEGKIVEWYVDKGQNVSSGDPIVKMETDKVVTDIPSPKTGVIVQRFGALGDVVKVGSALVEIEIEGVTGEDAVSEARKEPASASSEQVEEKGFGVVGTIEVAGDGAYLPASGEGMSSKPEDIQSKPKSKVLATPVARAMAKDLGVDINQVSGTGPVGRVTKKDIQAYHDSRSYLDAKPIDKPKPDTQDRVTIKPLSMIRKTIARNMSRSKHNAAHMSVMDEVEISALYEARQKANQKLEDRKLKISYLPFVIKAVALALKAHPALNAELDLEGDRIIYKNYYNIGIAVDTEDGLVVPVIRDADKKSLIAIANELKIISEKSRDRKLEPQDLKDGTFSVTSFGSIGGYFAVPVINYPQAAILGIGKITDKPVIKGDQVVPGKVLPISMSVDHRIVDGGEVARFLNLVLDYLKDPIYMMLELGENNGI